MTQRYDTYKDSGVQWLGEIPGHWGCVALSKVSDIILGKMLQSETKKDTDMLVPYICAKDVHFDGIDMSNLKTMYFSQSEMDMYEVRKGDMLIVEGGAGAGNCSILRNNVKNIGIQNSIMIVRSNADVINSYICYFMSSIVRRGYVDFITNIATIPHFTKEKVSRTYIPLPLLSEQRSIVSFLDAKCGKIDEWVTKKQKEVEHLQELKQRVIADAVTRGLNPHVKMKATNIPWLKEIPEHWEMSKISSHFRQRNEKVSDKDYPALSVSKQGVTPQLDNVALSNAEGASRKLVKVGDYAVNSRSDRKGSCGVSKYEGSVSLITIVLEPFNLNGEYVHYLFRSNPWVEEFYRNGRGIVADLWTTNYQMMKSMYMPVPPLSEQRSIVSYLDAKTSKIDKLIANITKEIERIKEYKQRLISDVVTGQIKVC